MAHPHPYYPTDVHLPGYQPLVLPFEFILFVFFGVTFIAMAGMWMLSGKYKYLSLAERLQSCWFLASGEFSQSSRR